MTLEEQIAALPVIHPRPRWMSLEDYALENEDCWKARLALTRRALQAIVDKPSGFGAMDGSMFLTPAELADARRVLEVTK